MNYEAVIGLEVHIELETKSKMFCACSADYFTAKPNTHTCPVCLGLPGAMPVANRKAIEFAQKFGAALGCRLNSYSKLDRKNYFYPDLAKGFQISQYDLPFSEKGKIEITVDGKSKTIDITRAHLEEDTGKLTHSKVNGKEATLIDFNRSGVPLLEIVTEPDMKNAQEAKAYAQKLQQIARYLEVSNADMEKGSMRVEPNVSIRKAGLRTLPKYKVELKNINSFRFAEKAVNFEIERQTKALENGEKLEQETRGWNEKLNKTVVQRSKEEAHDYRYFPEPDVPPLNFKKESLSELINKLPEMPDLKAERFQKEFGLSAYDSQVLTQDKQIAEFFEEANRAYMNNDAKKVANWITGELLRRLNEQGKSILDYDLLPANLAELLHLIDKGQITQNLAKDIFASMLESGKSAQAVVKSMNLTKMSPDDLGKLVKSIIEQNPQAVADFKKGKEESIGFLIGQVQRKTKGAADPSETRHLLLKILENSIEKNQI